MARAMTPCRDMRLAPPGFSAIESNVGRQIRQTGKQSNAVCVAAYYAAVRTSRDHSTACGRREPLMQNDDVTRHATRDPAALQPDHFTRLDSKARPAAAEHALNATAGSESAFGPAKKRTAA